MELIIKPTEKCNFKCTFCSSPNLSEKQGAVLPLAQVFQFLDRFPKTQTIIVNGGDPLMMSPDYYWSILNYIKEKELPTQLSFTTNLWAFYKNPKLWKDLFQHPTVGVSTSFNYGKTRRVTNEQVYTEELFWKVSNLFLSEVGYRPPFISVINVENEDTAIDNVYLAKEMDVECKLNYALASGRQSKPYLKGKIYRTYIEIIKKGLTPWEYNSQQILKRRDSLVTTCPQNRGCDAHIRVLQPEGDYYSCGAFGDDKEYSIDFEAEMSSNVVATPLQDDPEIHSLKQECYTCPLFAICNGCKKTIRDIKSRNLVEDHCFEMQKNMQDLAGLLEGSYQSLN